MPFYRIHIPLWRFKGAKTGRVYSATAGLVVEVPEGEFKALKKGEYDLLQTEPVEEPKHEENDG